MIALCSTSRQDYNTNLKHNQHDDLLKSIRQKQNSFSMCTYVKLFLRRGIHLPHLRGILVIEYYFPTSETTYYDYEGCFEESS